MAEANSDENHNDSLLAGLEQGDLTSGIYEGGFKTWECSIDLASLVADLQSDHNLHVLELGAGSAIPSLTVLNAMLTKVSHPLIHFTLCDYNEDVLKLATAPNVFLVAERCKYQVTPADAEEDMDIEDIDKEKVAACTYYLESKGVSFDFISGAWGEDFLHLIQSATLSTSEQPYTTLILASETIYSPKSTTTFVNTLIQLLRRDAAHSKAWVAAKKVYFGVGGGVDDFVKQVKKQHGYVKTLLDVKDVGVGRVVLEVTVGN